MKNSNDSEVIGYYKEIKDMNSTIKSQNGF
jgi:hypothetical protein